MSLEAEWARCRPWIEAALENQHGTYLVEDVEAEIAAGRAVFWPGRRAAVVTEFIEYPRRRALNFWLLGGDGRELVKHMRPAIEAWGAANGCDLFLGFGSHDRPSWGRALTRFGYAPGWNAYVKDIADGR